MTRKNHEPREIDPRTDHLIRPQEKSGKTFLGYDLEKAIKEGGSSFTDDEIAKCLEKYDEPTETSLEERLVEILQVKTGRPWHWGNAISNVSRDGDILVAGVDWDYGDGDTDHFTFKIPVELLNKEEKDWKEWWEQLEEQEKIADEIEELKSSISSLDEKEESMLKAFQHLQDPEWVSKKIQEVNAAINANDKNRTGKKQSLAENEAKIDPGIAKCIVENRSYGSIPCKKVRKIDTTESWRDLCK